MAQKQIIEILISMMTGCVQMLKVIFFSVQSFLLVSPTALVGYCCFWCSGSIFDDLPRLLLG